MVERVLLLNGDYQPLRFITKYEAITLEFKGKVNVIEKTERVIRTVNEEFIIPAVIALKQFIKLPFSDVKVSRNNILRRDRHQCNYCGTKDDVLTIDHILPKSKGGKHTWKNLTASCRSCNSKKGDLTPEEAGMKLIQKPFKPTRAEFFKNYIGLNEIWEKYLGID